MEGEKCNVGSLKEGEWSREVGSLMEKEWSFYGGGQFNGGRMVMLQRRSL